MARMERALVCVLFLGFLAVLSHAEDNIYARNGQGFPVSWWVVYKLPMLSRSDGANSTHLQPTPCDCPPPNCSQLPTEGLNVSVRATGLCYLYADSNNATLRYFRELGYDCLGQGGNDPLSHTMRHIQPRNSSNTSVPTEAKYWAIFNDQLNGIAESFQPPLPLHEKAHHQFQERAEGKRVCAGGDLFSAHAKGAVAFDANTGGGVYLQTSTPNFPDPSRVAPSSPRRRDRFIPLGCQRGNNVQFGQHMAALSLEMAQLNTLGKNLQAARLCSGNFYRDLHFALASESFRMDGAMLERNANFTDVYKALYDPELPLHDTSPTFTVQLRAVQEAEKRSKVFVPLTNPGEMLAPSISKTESIVEESTTVTVTVKSPHAAVPPWALLSEVMESDMSVASWWDGSFGIPNICAGDIYTNATNQFCLADAAHGVALNPNGSAKFNIENLIEAAWLLPNASEKVRWHLVGGTQPDGNHAKWGISTPRYGAATTSADQQRHLVVFADLNMEGYPCSTSCRGSQAGRGGSFFAFDNHALHATLVDSLITKACPCTPPDSPSHEHSERSDQSFETLRMCRMGCWRKVQDRFQPHELPVLSSEAASFWSNTSQSKGLD